MANKNLDYPPSPNNNNKRANSALTIDETDSALQHSVNTLSNVNGMKRHCTVDTRRERAEMDQWLNPTNPDSNHQDEEDDDEEVDNTSALPERRKGVSGQASKRPHAPFLQNAEMETRSLKQIRKQQRETEDEEGEEEAEGDSDTEDDSSDEEGDLVPVETGKGNANEKLSLRELTNKVLEIPMEDDESGNVKGSQLWKLTKASYHMNFHMCDRCCHRHNKLRAKESVKISVDGQITFKIPFCDDCVHLNMALSESSMAVRDLTGETFYRNGLTLKLAKILPRTATTLSIDLCKACNKTLYENKLKFLKGEKNGVRTLHLELTMCKKCMGQNSIVVSCCKKYDHKDNKKSSIKHLPLQ